MVFRMFQLNETNESEITRIQRSRSEKHTFGKNFGCILSTKFNTTGRLAHLVQVMPVAMAVYSPLLEGKPSGETENALILRSSRLPRTTHLFDFWVSGSRSDVLKSCADEVDAFSLEANLAFSVKMPKSIVDNLNSHQARMP